MSNQPKDAQIGLAILGQSPSIALRVDGKDDSILFITENVGELGYSARQLQAEKATWLSLVHPNDRDELCAKQRHFAQNQIDKYPLSYRMAKKDGSYIWMADSVCAVRDKGGEVLYRDHVMHDNTAMLENQWRVQENLRQRQVFSEILSTLHQGSAEEAVQRILARAGEYLGLSRAVLFEDVMEGAGCRAVQEWVNEGIAPMLGQEAFILSYQHDLPQLKAALDESGMRIRNYGEIVRSAGVKLQDKGVVASATFVVYRGMQRYGFICFDECEKERRWDNDTVMFLENIARLLGTVLVRMDNEEKIRHMVNHDPLTGLSNRHQFDGFVQRALDDARKASRHGYLMFIDMDDFKVINEGYGHGYGDALLMEVARYMHDNYADYCRIFRFGGDEFVILVRHEHAAQAERILEDLMVRGRHPWKVMDREFYSTLSVGMVRYPDGGSNAEDIIKYAEVAVHNAKNMGKNNYVIFNNEEIGNDSLQRAEMERRMRDAIENDFDGFKVYYQPVVNVRGEITGAEALLRWVDEEGHIISPAEFVPLAEYLGLIIPLGEFVLRQAARVCQRLNQTLPEFSINVNVSIRQFQHNDFLPRLESILSEEGVDYANIVLEMTEGMVIKDLEHMRDMIEQLRGMGLRLAMDDFGTGYSSLSNMRSLPLDIVKIDRAFIMDVAKDAYSQSFIRLITDLCHSMGRKVCVEGVETPVQYGYCAECRVDSIQGFYFYRPMPQQEFEQTVLKKVVDVRVTG